MVRDDFVSFTILKSLVICIGDLTTLAMVFLPKMLLVYKYTDFDRNAISRHVAQSMTESTQKDLLYEQLRVKDNSHASSQSGPNSNSNDLQTEESEYTSSS